MPRWRIVLVAFLLLAAGAWALLTFPVGSGETEPPHADIDDASKEALRSVLRQADEDPEAPAP